MILYTTNSCPLCKVAKAKLSSAGIIFESCTDEKIMEEKGIINVPVLEKDGKKLNFNEIIKMVQEVLSES